jgi:hypothetical protein
VRIRPEKSESRTTLSLIMMRSVQKLVREGGALLLQALAPPQRCRRAQRQRELTRALRAWAGEEASAPVPSEAVNDEDVD